MAESINSYIFSPVLITQSALRNQMWRFLCLLPASRVRHAKFLFMFYASIFQNFRFRKAWHAYPTDNLDLSQMHKDCFIAPALYFTSDVAEPMVFACQGKAFML